MSRQNILAIDCGTQSLRALIFDQKGQILAESRIEYQPYFSLNPGWAEQDPEVYWNALCSSCKQLRDQYPEEFKQICAVGVTTRRDTMINLDADGNPLRMAIIWLDQRKAKPAYHPAFPIRVVLKLK
jgi:sugar (pentulose or hexulose) kinase